eukprot:16389989-Heterocapsa_arctica.AAC.1
MKGWTEKGCPQKGKWHQQKGKDFGASGQDYGDQGKDKSLGKYWDTPIVKDTEEEEARQDESSC